MSRRSILQSVSLNIEPGETFVLLGPSGCGKTTLLRCVAGLAQPTGGSIELHGKEVFGPNVFVQPEQRSVGMVFQHGSLFPHMNVAQNVGFGLTSSDPERVDEVLELVEMSEFKDRSPQTLSGGQQQRVALARALAPAPTLLLLDEPFSALDLHLRSAIRKDVSKAISSSGCSTLLVTHDQDEAFDMGDRIGIMKDGNILQVSSPIDIYQNPVEPWVAEFVGEVNLVNAKAKAGFVQTPFGQMPISSPVSNGSEVVVAIRPEQLGLTVGNDFEIIGKQYFGHDVLYHVTHSSHSGDFSVRTQTNDQAIGDKVGILFNGSSVKAWLR